MTPLHRRVLVAKLALACLATFTILLLLGIVALLLWQSLGDNSSLPIGLVWLLVLLSAFWIWKLRLSPLRIYRVWQDLRSGFYQTIRGRGRVLTRQGFGLISPVQQQLRISGHSFDLRQSQLEQVADAEFLEVQISPDARILLAVESIDEESLGETPENAELQDYQLTGQELELLKLIASGLPDKLIARELDLAPSTVRTYNSTLFTKLGVSGRSAAKSLALEAGLVDVN